MSPEMTFIISCLLLLFATSLKREIPTETLSPVNYRYIRPQIKGANILKIRSWELHWWLSKWWSILQLRNIPRPLEPVSPSLEMDLLWADPVVGIQGFEPNLRGASFGFGEDVVIDVCKRLDIDMIARAHQVQKIEF